MGFRSRAVFRPHGALSVRGVRGRSGPILLVEGPPPNPISPPVRFSAVLAPIDSSRDRALFRAGVFTLFCKSGVLGAVVRLGGQ